MRVIFTKDDFTILPLEYPKDAYPVAPVGLKIDRSLKAKGMNEDVSDFQ